MTVQELTTTINKLTEEERLEVSRYVSSVLRKRPIPKAVKGYSEAELVKVVKKSRQESETGHTIPAYQSLAQICKQYDLSA